MLRILVICGSYVPFFAVELAKRILEKGFVEEDSCSFSRFCSLSQSLCRSSHVSDATGATEADDFFSSGMRKVRDFAVRDSLRSLDETGGDASILLLRYFPFFISSWCLFLFFEFIGYCFRKMCSLFLFLFFFSLSFCFEKLNFRILPILTSCFNLILPPKS